MDIRFERLLNNFFHWYINLDVPFKEAFDAYHYEQFFENKYICGELMKDKIEFKHICSEFMPGSEPHEYPNIIYYHGNRELPEGFDVYHYTEFFTMLDKLQGSKYEY